MEHVRIGVIGLGYIGTYYARALMEGKISRAELTAVCTPNPKAFNPFKRRTMVFVSSGELIRSGAVDAVLIATPQSHHAEIGIDALRHGLHVLVEKPLARHKTEAQRLIAVHTRRKQIFAIMFNQRVDPRYQWIQQAIASGKLGKLQRIHWVMTDWFRTNAYYASSRWRGTMIYSSFISDTVKLPLNAKKYARFLASLQQS